MQYCPECGSSIHFKIREMIQGAAPHLSCPSCQSELKAVFKDPRAKIAMGLLFFIEFIISIIIIVAAVAAPLPFLTKWAIAFGLLIGIASIFMAIALNIYKKNLEFEAIRSSGLGHER